jgi:outer membrane protein OmpA-like peptidoglycan-associated protein
MPMTWPALHPTSFARASALTLLLSLPAAYAADPPQGETPGAVLSNEQIQQALHPPMTRGFKPRGLKRVEQAEAEQSVSLNIPFEHNSSDLKPQASEQLKQLQLALTSASFQNDRFVVAGHTDATGNAQYNKQLSLRRAETVKRFLISKGIDARRLDTVGYGSQKLFAPDKPADARNRRVEIRDLGASSQ